MNSLLYEEESYVIRGAVVDVYREMGCGFLEAVYQECMEKEMARRNVPFVSQGDLRLAYKGEFLLQTYKPDFVCYGKIILELKAVKTIAPEHKDQVLNYLKAAVLKLRFLVNFGSHPVAEIERLIF